MGLKVSRTRPFAELTNDEFEHLAAKVAIAEKLVMDTAHETVVRFRQHWQAEKHHLPMTKQVREAIDAYIKSLPIAQEEATTIKHEPIGVVELGGPKVLPAGKGYRTAYYWHDGLAPQPMVRSIFSNVAKILRRFGVSGAVSFSSIEKS